MSILSLDGFAPPQAVALLVSLSCQITHHSVTQLSPAELVMLTLTQGCLLSHICNPSLLLSSNPAFAYTI